MTRLDKVTIDKLQGYFKPTEIEWRVGSTTQDKTKGMALCYLTNRSIQNRLDQVFGPMGWKNEYREWHVTSQLCGISIKDPDGEWITKWDGADQSTFEGTKGGLSDAMKRAAYQWGIGRYLYDFPDQWVTLKSGGKYFAQTPKVPNWAIPEGYGQPQQKPYTKPAPQPAQPYKPPSPPTAEPQTKLKANNINTGQKEMNQFIRDYLKHHDYRTEIAKDVIHRCKKDNGVDSIDRLPVKQSKWILDEIQNGIKEYIKNNPDMV